MADKESRQTQRQKKDKLTLAEKKQRNRQLQVQRDELASSVRRPQPQGLDSIDHPLPLVGGGVLALFGLKRWRSLSGLALAGIGAGLFYKGLQQNQLLDGNLKQRLLNTGASSNTHVRASITIDKPVDEVFQKWRDPSNLARSMRHIESAHSIDEEHWHFEARLPRTDFTVQWDAEIIDEIKNQLLVWRSVEGSEVHNEGVVEFEPTADGNATRLRARIVYYPPAGKLGKSIAGFLRTISEQVIKEDLRCFKQYLETGEVATIEGQTSGRRQIHTETTRSSQTRKSLR